MITSGELSTIDPQYALLTKARNRFRDLIRFRRSLNEFGLHELDVFTRYMRSLDRLDITHTIEHPPPPLLNFPTNLDWEKAVGINRHRCPDELRDPRFEEMKKRQEYGRKQEWITRIVYESVTADRKGWATVFNTLTVRSEDVLFNPVAFKAYLRNISRDIARRVYGSLKQARKLKINEREYHRYVAVVERGSKTGRLHLHLLHWCREVPGCFDPNAGRVVHDRREIARWKQYWPHGHSRPIAVRLGHDDYYGKKGWFWPQIKKRGTLHSAPAKGCTALAGYLGKYINKTKPGERSKRRWRVRCTQKLGHEEAKEITYRMIPALDDPTSLEVRVSLRQSVTRFHGRRLPAKLLTRLLLNEKKKLMSSKQKFQTWQNEPPGADCLLELVSTSTRWKEEYRLLSIGCIQMRNLIDEVAYSAAIGVRTRRFAGK